MLATGQNYAFEATCSLTALHVATTTAAHFHKSNNLKELGSLLKEVPVPQTGLQVGIYVQEAMEVNSR